MPVQSQASINELYRVPAHCKAEIVNGEIVLMSATGDMPGRASGAIYASLRSIERQAGGRVFPDNVGFIVDLPNRKSFSPDAAFYTGKPSGMKFIEGAPVFAAEVRSENDYGDKAEIKMAAKRRDYFAAGTLVVWDVDLLSDDVVKVYSVSSQDTPRIYHRGEFGGGEPAGA